MKDYKELGFRCGLEIHQQLEGKKLFCNCNTLNSSREANTRFERYLRASAGETGEIDVAALYEMKKGKGFVYDSHSEDTCLVEFDEEPPHNVNPEALRTALVIAKLLNCKVEDEIHFMRKIVIDGSNTSAFQRTALVGRNGYIKTSKGNVRVASLCLEEEAAKKIEDAKDFTKYRLDRLGIPLLEIATETDIVDPEHAKETASAIGMILRSVPNVKRGLGTIRQDVNISIKGGARTEIKGFQDLRSIPKVIDFEVERQQKLLREKKSIQNEVRKAEPDFTTSFLRPMPGAARMYPETDIPPIQVTKEMLEVEKPVSLAESAENIEKEFGIRKDLAQLLAKSGKLALFASIAKKNKNVKPAFIVETLISAPKEIKRKFEIEINRLADKEYEEIFSYLNEGKISKDVVFDVLIDYAKGEFDIGRYAKESGEDIEKEIKKICDENKGASQGALMGIVMQKFRGKIDGKKAMEVVKKYSG